MALKDMTGSVFGALTVIHREKNLPDGTATWRCVCQCGNTRVIAGTKLRAGRNKSCGCLLSQLISESLKTHGKSKDRIYNIWLGMIFRCSPSNKTNSKKTYYDKGINVCDRWMTFENFLEDMGIPEPHQSIDRKDNNKGYNKENCRWADWKTQANNKSTNLIINLHGISKTASEWSDETGIKANTIVYRIRRGWSVERALEKNPVHIGTQQKLLRSQSCEICKKIFIPRRNQVIKGRGRFCSQKCHGSFRKLSNHPASY